MNAKKFLESISDVDDDALTDMLHDTVKDGLLDQVKILVQKAAKKAAGELGIKITDEVRSSQNGVVQFDYAVQLLLAAYLDNPRMVQDYFNAIKD